MIRRDLSKLYKLREWLTVQEAAIYVSTVVGSDIDEAEILRLALDGHLRLSVYLMNHAVVKRARLASATEVVEFWETLGVTLEPHQEDGMAFLKKGNLPAAAAAFSKTPDIIVSSERFFIMEGEPFSISGVFDLPMVGGEELDVEHCFQTLTNGPAVELCDIEGVFVAGIDGQLLQIQTFTERELGNPVWEPREYYPAANLPEGSRLVVRTAYLRDFEKVLEEISDQSQDRPPERKSSSADTNSQRTLLILVASLCQALNLKPDDRSVSGVIARWTEGLGSPVSSDTVRKWLNQIPAALNSRKGPK